MNKIYATKKERIAELEVNVKNLRSEIETLKMLLLKKQDKIAQNLFKLEPDPFTRRYDGGLPVECGIGQ
jgi:hypothetical protein